MISDSLVNSGDISVLGALWQAYDLRGRPVTAFEVRRTGDMLCIGVSDTVRGSHAAFAHESGTRLFLERLVKMGLVDRPDDGKYYPLVGEVL